MIKIKQTYLIFLIVIGLVSLSLYTTYAMFTASTTLNNVVNFDTSLSLNPNLLEYELITLTGNETQVIEVNVTNSYDSTLCYGIWYEVVSGDSSSLDIGTFTEKNTTLPSGQITSGSTITAVVGMKNNSDFNIVLKLGTIGKEISSSSCSLGITSPKSLIGTDWDDVILVTDEYLSEHIVTSSEDYSWSSSTSGSTTLTLNPGEYKLEVWGAEGGTGLPADTGDVGTHSSTTIGGKGGYSYGTLKLTDTTTVYAYVGGQGIAGNSTSSIKSGGFNGGGNSGYYQAGSGGGASDIRIGTDSLYARVIVAGGGGGGANYSGYVGGAGGGTSGINGTGNDNTYTAKAGSSTSGGTAGGYSGYTGSKGTFGQGGAANTSSSSYSRSGGGGGGWYGGGGGGFRSSALLYFNGVSGGGGGSGYVYTSETASNYPSGCLLDSSHYLTYAATISGTNSFMDFDGTIVTGHSGNGAIKITGTTNAIYSIPTLSGLTTLRVKLGTTVDYTTGVEVVCASGTTGCSIVTYPTLDTSTLEEGTYTVYYIVKGSNNKKYKYARTINIEMSPNSPDLVDGLIPVMYNGSNWVKADSTNSNNSWYNYSDKQWANAVLVSSTNRSAYQSAAVGTEISMSDILAFYVWIPRYKYKVWNISKQVGAESSYAYNAYSEGIDIVFEEETASTGTITCSYNFNVDPDNGGIDLNTTTAETCNGSNGEYYTHPAFCLGETTNGVCSGDGIRGFWIGKFELSSSSPQTEDYYGGGLSTSLTPRVLPNVTSWRYNYLSDFNTVIQNMTKSSNIYGLNASTTSSHMLTNMEWGAVAYLTNSKYGRCTNGTCTEVAKNSYGETSYSTTMTGCGPISSGSTSYGTTCNAYDTTLGMSASTTGNITGVYDMSGGAIEYVMGNISSTTTTYVFYPSSSGFKSSSWYTSDTSKFLTTYACNESDSNKTTDQIVYNLGRLGDATAEVVFSTGGKGGWYSSSTYFPWYSYAWFGRGGTFSYDVTFSLFSFHSTNGDFDYYGWYHSTRTALFSLN